MKKLLLIVFILLLSIILVNSATAQIPPLGWKKYENKQTNHHYSFFYPNEWFLKECQRGEIVLSSKPIAKCKLPLDANISYIHPVYLQTFIPENGYKAWYQVKEESLPKKLQGWKNFNMHFDEDSAMFNDWIHIRISNEYIPIKNILIPLDSRSTAIIENNDGRDAVIEKLDSFVVGFYPHQNDPQMKKIMNSFHYTYAN